MEVMKEKQPTLKASKIIIDDIQLGVWRLKVGETSGWSLRGQLDSITSAYPLFYRLFSDVFSLSPRIFTLFFVCQLWSGIEDAVLMHLSSSLLRMIEAGIVTGNPDKHGILWAMFSRLACAALAACLAWYSQINMALLRRRITQHFSVHLLKSQLEIDLATSQEATSEQKISASAAWEAIEEIVSFMTEVLTTGSQLALIVHLSRTTGGPTFAILCTSKPLISAAFNRTLWDKVCFGFVENLSHRRLKALEGFANGGYRQDIISGNLSDWIVKEYQKANRELREVSDEYPYASYSRRTTPTFNVFTRVLGDFPMVYCALIAIFYPSKFSVASIAILQQSSSTLRYSLETVFRSNEKFRKSVADVKRFYETTEAVNTMQDGTLSYPRIEEKDKWKSDRGMSFELSNVSFSYPGSQKTSGALTDVSIAIKAGQLIVVVGANGSGKSTLVRILARLYDPTSGQILIDGRPSGEYCVKDLHHATAILSQDNLIYPLTLAENIGLGYPDHSSDVEMIKEAAEDGGASEFMKKLKYGIQTSLNPHAETFHHNLHGNNSHPLYHEMKQMEKEIDISGGEKQRVVAARAFMRFKSGKVRFVAVDEPSSALDAEAELQLFTKLLGIREGKTMVFVTHRFGHLTKHADQIICMKDGTIVETGTHETLMEKKGEYAKLYEIQASAFEHNNGGVISSSP
ncbi:hypothetical protein M413DRAFT_440368 [Hebeloma cylindrosporum]|uniref:ABC transporter domain-containing protein n=1 Tax=Hebeloma cylindrosporum TaxID=76867 RepID=A0A0C2YAD8_HEBCY|nr:hypothetical protein M413DRAFT_440368 [Hebeloma cylindrosporum h7]